MNRIIFIIFSAFASDVFCQSGNPVFLDCTAKPEILVTNSWEVTNKDDYLIGDQETLNISVSDNEIAVEGLSFKNSENGLIYVTPTKYEATYLLKIGDRNLANSNSPGNAYHLSQKSIQIWKLSGEFRYKTVYYIDDLRSSIHQKFNKNNLASGFVIRDFYGRCKKSNSKQLF